MKLLNKGFTLIEILVTMAILASCLCGLLGTHINMLFLSDLSRDFTLATNAIQLKMEEIKKTNFDNLLALFNGTTFDINGFTSSDAKGRVEVCDKTTCPTLIPYSDLKRVRVTVCFKSRGRLIGNNIDNCQSSPVELVTLIAK